MKLNISYPKHGANKMLEIEDEKKLRVFTDKRLSEEVPGDTLGDEFKGYVFKIAGGFDKQGFAMVQGVATAGRVRLLLDGRTGMYTPKRSGCRKRKSVRGCIVGNDLSCLNLVIVHKGPQELPGLTDPDSNKPSMRGPKRATKIRKLWGLTKEDDVRLFVPKRKITKEGKKEQIKSPKIQRLVTPVTLRRKKRRLALKKQRYTNAQESKAKYEQILAQLRKEKRAALLSKKREIQSERKSVASTKKSGADVKAAPAKDAKPADAKAAPAKDAKPADTKAAAKPADAKAAPKDAKPADAKAAPAKDAKPADTKAAAKPADAKAAAKPADAKAAPAKGAKPADAKAPAKPADTKAPAPKPATPAQPAAQPAAQPPVQTAAPAQPPAQAQAQPQQPKQGAKQPPKGKGAKKQ
jgi:small subunit ribosomal protein S6e